MERYLKRPALDRPGARLRASPAERFLDEFHDARPGLTSKAFGALPVVFRERQFASSYEVLASLVPWHGAPAEVLDLACGAGHLLQLLARRCEPGLALAGADMNRSELALARASLGPAVALCRARAQALPFGSGRFDHVLCHLALMLMDDAERVLGEVRRVLKPGGVLAAVVGAPPPPSVALTTYVEALARRPRQARFSDVRLGDRRFRSPDGIEELLSLSFRDLTIDDLRISRRLAPDELWRWLLGMYDLHLLDATERIGMEREYLGAIAPHCGPDGRLEFHETLRVVGAKAA